MNDVWPWVLVALLGAYHGVNPAMGWLFAVGLGLQERDRRAVLHALPPIALGHELAIIVVVVAVLVLDVVASSEVLHIGAAVALVGFGIFRFARPRLHPRWTRARVNRRELSLWSFLMSSAHGAGLMVTPVLIGAGAETASADDHALEAASPGSFSLVESGLAVSLHVGAMLLVMGVVALLVYEKLGVSILRRAWLNLDGLWAGTFVVAGVITFFT